MDAQIGRLIDGLRAVGRFDDTIVAVTADHGQGLADHDWAMHRILYQEQIRVPLIVRVPGLRPVPAQGDLVRTVDIARRCSTSPAWPCRRAWPARACAP